MTDPTILFRAQVTPITDAIIEAFDREVQAMSRRRAAAGSYRSGAMLIDVADGIKTGFVLLRDKGEETLTSTWTNSLWVSAADEQTMQTDLGAEFDRINAHGLAVLHARVADLNAPRTLPELELGVQQRLDECRAHMVVVCELQRRTHNVSKIKRGIGMAGPAVGTALKWLTGLAAK